MPPASLISSTASRVPIRSPRSITEVTPVWENSMPIRIGSMATVFIGSLSWSAVFRAAVCCPRLALCAWDACQDTSIRAVSYTRCY